MTVTDWLKLTGLCVVFFGVLLYVLAVETRRQR